MTARKLSSTFLLVLCFSLITTLMVADMSAQKSNKKTGKAAAGGTTGDQMKGPPHLPPVNAQSGGGQQGQGDAEGGNAAGGRQEAGAPPQQAGSAGDNKRKEGSTGGAQGNRNNTRGAAGSTAGTGAGSTSTAGTGAAGTSTGNETPRNESNRTSATANQNSTPPPPPPPPPSPTLVDSIFAWVPTVLLTLAALSLIGSLFWWTWEKIHGVNARTDGLVRGLIKRQDDKFQELGAAVSGIKDLNGRFTTLQESVLRLVQTVEGLRKEQLLQNRLAGASAVAPIQPVGYGRPNDGYADDSVDFPIAANNFLTRVSGPQQIIKPDPLKNLLVKDPDGRGQLVLVRDGSVPGGQLYIIPRITRFQTMQDFYIHYEQFYDCDHPTAGEVWVNEPAVVDGVDGGWKLRDKGILEVKS